MVAGSVLLHGGAPSHASVPRGRVTAHLDYSAGVPKFVSRFTKY